MRKKIDISEYIGQIFKKEAAAIHLLTELDTTDIQGAIAAISRSKGKVVVAGLGKSAIVARKFVATLNSTGTTAVFLHAADALHGDMGVISAEDVLISISKSGSTDEVVTLVDAIKHQGCITVCITNVRSSPLAVRCDHPIVLPHVQEADDDSIVPTVSILQHLACCDAIGLTLQRIKGRDHTDFVKLHPHGSLGRLLSLTAADLAADNPAPMVSPEAEVKTVIYTISTNKLGACCVVEDGSIKGIITDGDIRRMLETHDQISHITASMIMTTDPIKIIADASGQEAKEVMARHNINQLIVTNHSDQYLGIIHIQNLI